MFNIIRSTLGRRFFHPRSDVFKLKDLVTIESLMDARVHLGHKTSLMNEHMRPFIYGNRLGVQIIDLNQTYRLLNQALLVTAEIAYRDGIILFVHDSRQNSLLVEEAARECSEFALCRSWLDAILTDSKRTFGAVTRLPDLCLVFNCSHGVVRQASNMLIPTIGICDTNTDPTLVTWPVPGNDDSPQSVEFYCNVFKTAILNAKALRQKEGGIENSSQRELKSLETSQ